MFKDRMPVWVLEYIFGGVLVIVPLTSRVLCLPAWTDAHKWATQLFVVSLGVILISCASSLFADVITALNADIGDPTPATGTLRVGIHVGSIGGGGDSDAFVLTPPPVVHTALAGAFLLVDFRTFHDGLRGP
jgi:hypothetical protein